MRLTSFFLLLFGYKLRCMQQVNIYTLFPDSIHIIAQSSASTHPSTILTLPSKDLVYILTLGMLKLQEEVGLDILALTSAEI